MVSIIIPVYKVESYLRECIESVLGQTYSDLQVILVDDGSPDNCGAICDEYAKKDGRILALHKKNGGVSSARNFGLEYATGEYVTFCDSDDWYAPDWIERLVHGIQQCQADIAIGNYVRVLSDGSFGTGSAHETGVDDISQLQKKVEYIFQKLLSPKHAWEACTRLFSMEAIRREKLRFCETCGNYGEDLGFTFLCTLFANRVISIENAGYCYRMRDDSMMHTSANDTKLESLYMVTSDCHPVAARVFGEGMAEWICGNLDYILLGNEFISKMWVSGLHPVAFRKRTLESFSDWPSMKNRIRYLLNKKRKMGFSLSKSRKIEILFHFYFLLGMPWFFLRAECKLNRFFHPVPDGEHGRSVNG